jgi:hypothetical protein
MKNSYGLAAFAQQVTFSLQMVSSSGLESKNFLLLTVIVHHFRDVAVNKF